MRTKRRWRPAAAIAVYILGFVCVALAHAWPFVRDGRYFIFGADCFTQHYPAFLYIQNYCRDTLAGWAQGRWMPQLFSFSLGLGGDVLSTLNYYGLGNPFYLLGLFFPEHRLPLAFSLILVLQYFLAGLAFWGFCRKMGLRGAGPVVGAWLYVFTGFYLMALEHPIMAHAVLALPLMLWGTEKILRHESPLLLAAAVFCTALCGFYFLFTCSVVLAFYVLIRVWQRRTECYFRALVVDALRSLAAYFSGLGMACAVFLPGVLGFLSSSRTGSGTGGVALLSGPDVLREWLLQWFDPGADWFVGGLCLLALAFVLGSLRSGGRDRTALVIGFAVALVFVVSPLAQAALVGFGNSVYTRFWFCISFLFAYMAAAVWEDLFDLTREQLLMGGGAVLLYVLLSFASGMGRWQKLGSLFLVLLYLAILLGQPHVQKSERRQAAARLVCGGVTAALTLVQLGGSLYLDAESVHDAYRNDRFARQMPAVTAEQLPEGEYRVDTSDVGLHRWWAASNAPLTGGYKGISEYFSILSSDYANAMLNDWTLAPAQQGSFSFQGFDGCAALNTLAGVRYSFVRPGEEGYVPYGYSYVGDTVQSRYFTMTPDNGAMLNRYENLYALPLGFAYDLAISAAEYDAMNALQKQAAMMQGLAVEQLPENVECGSPDLTGVARLEAVFEPGEGVLWENGRLMVSDDLEEGGVLTVRFAVEKDTEVHLCLTGFCQEAGHGETWVYFCMEGGQERAVRMSDAVDPEAAWVNLGWVPAGDYTAKIELEAGQSFTLSGLELWGYDMADYAAHASARAETVLQNIVVDTNSVAGLLQTEKDTLLFLSIPYSEGWHATVDGVPAVPQKANSMFMALEVPAGEHVIGLYYITPGLKAGCMLTALGGVTLLAQLGWYYHKKLCQKKEAAVCT